MDTSSHQPREALGNKECFEVEEILNDCRALAIEYPGYLSHHAPQDTTYYDYFTTTVGFPKELVDFYLTQGAQLLQFVLGSNSDSLLVPKPTEIQYLEQLHLSYDIPTLIDLLVEGTANLEDPKELLGLINGVLIDQERSHRKRMNEVMMAIFCIAAPAAIYLKRLERRLVCSENSDTTAEERVMAMSVGRDILAPICYGRLGDISAIIYTASEAAINPEKYQEYRSSLVEKFFEPNLGSAAKRYISTLTVAELSLMIARHASSLLSNDSSTEPEASFAFLGSRVAALSPSKETMKKRRMAYWISQTQGLKELSLEYLVGPFNRVVDSRRKLPPILSSLGYSNFELPLDRDIWTRINERLELFTSMQPTLLGKFGRTTCFHNLLNIMEGIEKIPSHKKLHISELRQLCGGTIHPHFAMALGLVNTVTRETILNAVTIIGESSYDYDRFGIRFRYSGALSSSAEASLDQYLYQRRLGHVVSKIGVHDENSQVARFIGANFLCAFCMTPLTVLTDDNEKIELRFRKNIPIEAQIVTPESQLRGQENKTARHIRQTDTRTIIYLGKPWRVDATPSSTSFKTLADLIIALHGLMEGKSGSDSDREDGEYGTPGTLFKLFGECRADYPNLGAVVNNEFGQIAIRHIEPPTRAMIERGLKEAIRVAGTGRILGQPVGRVTADHSKYILEELLRYYETVGFQMERLPEEYSHYPELLLLSRLCESLFDITSFREILGRNPYTGELDPDDPDADNLDLRKNVIILNTIIFLGLENLIGLCNGKIRRYLPAKSLTDFDTAIDTYYNSTGNPVRINVLVNDIQNSLRSNDPYKIRDESLLLDHLKNMRSLAWGGQGYEDLHKLYHRNPRSFILKIIGDLKSVVISKLISGYFGSSAVNDFALFTIVALGINEYREKYDHTICDPVTIKKDHWLVQHLGKEVFEQILGVAVV
ncbi:MAG: hypothetical protein QY318_02215 [Candidatus Dojkabacteria bacterium]|nr:MAG: hypothetical protein QY318_02215 [Candidatus Dojkabacteria bacterium]